MTADDYINMNNKITVKVAGKTLSLDRNLLLSESENPQIQNNSNVRT